MTSEDDCLVKYAFNEQKSLNMSRYRKINSTSPSANSFQLQIELHKPTNIKAYG